MTMPIDRRQFLKATAAAAIAPVAVELPVTERIIRGGCAHGKTLNSLSAFSGRDGKTMSAAVEMALIAIGRPRA